MMTKTMENLIQKIDNNVWKCSACSITHRIFVKLSAIEDHVMKEHFKESKLEKCLICHKKFQDLKGHLITCKKEPLVEEQDNGCYNCLVCDMQFAKKEIVVQHIKLAHKKVKREVTRDQEQIEVVTLNDENEDPEGANIEKPKNLLNVLDKLKDNTEAIKVPENQDLETGEVIKTERSVKKKCLTCGEYIDFKNKKYFKKHVVSCKLIAPFIAHTNGSYRCEICDKKAGNRKTLSSHITRQHGKDLDKNGVSKTSKAVSIYQPINGQTTQVKDNETKISSKTNSSSNKIVKCEYCSKEMKVFDTRKTKIDRHMKLCKMYFQHMEQVLGTLKFKCLLCIKVCETQGSCFNHFTAVHKDLIESSNQDQLESDTEPCVGYDMVSNSFIDVVDVAKKPMLRIESLDVKDDLNDENSSMLEIDNAHADTEDSVEQMLIDNSDDTEEFEIKDEMDNVSNEDNTVQAPMLQDHTTQVPMTHNQVPEKLLVPDPLVPSTMNTTCNIQDTKAINRKEAIRNILNDIRRDVSEIPSKDIREDNEDEDEIEMIETITRPVKTEFLPTTRGPKPVTSLSVCPICNDKFLSEQMASEHVQQEHKIPIDKFTQFNIQIGKFEF